jgi:hypothetical protein
MSSCEFYRHIGVLSSCCFPHGMTDVVNNISETYPRRIGQAKHEIKYAWRVVKSLPHPAWVSLGNVVYHTACDSCEFDRHIGMLSSCCEFDRHVGVLSSSCEFDRHIIMLSSFLCSPNKDFGRRKKRLTPLKRASKIRIVSFVHPSNIFVWGA